jgi:uncharacterized membrane protein
LRADDPVLLTKLIEFFSLELHTRHVVAMIKLFFWKMVNKQHSNATQSTNFGNGFLVVATTILGIVFLSL